MSEFDPDIDPLTPEQLAARAAIFKELRRRIPENVCCPHCEAQLVLMGDADVLRLPIGRLGKLGGRVWLISVEELEHLSVDAQINLGPDIFPKG